MQEITPVSIKSEQVKNMETKQTPKETTANI